MPTYNVTIPCTMAVCVTVEADDPKAAIDAAFDVEWNVNLTSDDKAAAPDLIELETHRRVAYGNVYAGCINDVDVQEA